MESLVKALEPLAKVVSALMDNPLGLVFSVVFLLVCLATFLFRRGSNRLKASAFAALLLVTLILVLTSGADNSQVCFATLDKSILAGKTMTPPPDKDWTTNTLKGNKIDVCMDTCRETGSCIGATVSTANNNCLLFSKFGGSKHGDTNTSRVFLPCRVVQP